MSLIISEMYDICCHECGTNWSDEHGFAMSEEQKNQMEEKAEQAGWKYKNGLNLCPDCSK